MSGRGGVMMSREFLFGLVIFGTLAAWTVSAKSQEITGDENVSQAVGDSKIELLGDLAAEYSSQRLTPWKNVQLVAAAMTNPSSIESYQVLTALPASDLASLGDDEISDFLRTWEDDGSQVAVKFNDGRLAKFKNSTLNATSCESCELSISAAISNIKKVPDTKIEFGRSVLPNGEVIYTMGSTELVDTENFVFLLNDDSQIASGTKYLLKPLEAAETIEK